ncbi:MAG: TetR/AcrR family transcriptional regulator [Ignavibacteria bacterium]|nr:TetR/AcrR family transcriptional regulator [Ignavibacteria bacterium]
MSHPPGITDDQVAKERVYEFARREFFHHGFARISVGTLTTGVGMSKKTFYKFFSSKEELVQLMADRMIQAIAVPMDGIVNSRDDFIKKLHKLLSHLASNVAMINSSFAHDLQRYQPQMWSRLEEFRRRRITEVFSRIFEQGRREGFMRQHVNQKIFLLSYLAAIERIMQPAFLAQEPYSARDALEQLVSIFFTGILTPGATRKLARHRQSVVHH